MMRGSGCSDSLPDTESAWGQEGSQKKTEADRSCTPFSHWESAAKMSGQGDVNESANLRLSQAQSMPEMVPDLGNLQSSTRRPPNSEPGFRRRRRRSSSSRNRARTIGLFSVSAGQ